MPSQQQQAPPPNEASRAIDRAGDLSIAEMTRIMDVASTLRRERSIAERELSLDETKRVLRERLIETARVTGDPVSEAEIDAAIEHYFETQHRFEPAEPGVETFLATLYVMRNELMIGAAVAVAGVAAVFWGVFG